MTDSPAKTITHGPGGVNRNRQDAGRQRSRTFVSCPRPLTSHATAPRKGRQDVGAFREASQPVGGTRAHSLDVHVGHPWPPFTARARRFALQAALASGARSWARAPPTSSNVVRTGSRERKRPDRQKVGRRTPFSQHWLPAGDRMSPMSTSGSVRTSASHASAPRKVGQEARAFREASRRQ